MTNDISHSAQCGQMITFPVWMTRDQPLQERRKEGRKGWRQCRVLRSVSGFYGTKQLIKSKVVGKTRYLTRHECNEKMSRSIMQTCQPGKTTKQ